MARKLSKKDREAKENLIRKSRKKIKGLKNKEFRVWASLAVDDYEFHDNPTNIRRLYNLKRFPVLIEEFVCSKEYLHKKHATYPKVLEELDRINNPILSSGVKDRFTDTYYEVLLTGSIGAYKTHIAVYTLVYHTYLMSCLRDPHLMFSQDPASELLIVFQSISNKQAKDVSFTRYRKIIEGSPYFVNNFPWDKDIDSEMRFPNRIIARPVGSTSSGAIGENAIYGLMDEINHGEIIESSKRSWDGKVYNQVLENYNALARRRKSRFLDSGVVFGLFCLVGSRVFPGQFSDIKEAERDNDIKTTGKSGIYLYDKRTWEMAPEGKYSGDTFDLFVGDQYRSPRVLKEDEELVGDDVKNVMPIPIEHLSDFVTKDIYNALREIAGISIRSIAPFILNVSAVNKGFNLLDSGGLIDKNLLSVFSRDEVDFVNSNLEIYEDLFQDKQFPRYAHLDLAVTQDSAGLAMGYVNKFVPVDRGPFKEMLPNIVFDGVLRIVPPPGKEIDFSTIRALLFLIRRIGINLKWVSADQFQSVDMLQQLYKAGFKTGRVSLDTSVLPYSMAKYAFYDGRVTCPYHEKAREEFLGLERNYIKDKVDHPVNGSKDISDSMGATIYGLTMQREIWRMFGQKIILGPGGELPGSGGEQAEDGITVRKSLLSQEEVKS
jgi:hypothetical protein